MLRVDSANKNITYWAARLQSCHHAQLSSSTTTSKVKHNTPGRFTFTLDRAVIDQLARLNIALPSSLMSALHTTLLYCGNPSDICIGYTVNPCDRNAVLPVKLNFPENEPTFSAAAQLMNTTLVEAQAHRLPFSTIAAEHFADRDDSSQLPLGALLVLKATNTSTHAINDALVAGSNQATLQAEFLTMTCTLATDTSLSVEVTYPPERLTAADIAQFTQRFQLIVTQLAAQPHTNLFDVPVISGTEEEQIVRLNTTFRPQQIMKMLPDELHHVGASADATQAAVVFHGKNANKHTVAYGELEARTNRLANYIFSISAHAKSPTLGICLPRSSALVPTVIAGFKTGQTLVTMDPNEPRVAREKTSLTKPIVVIADNSSYEIFADSNVIVVNIDDPATKQAIANTRADYTSPNVSPDSVAYIMRTSGSTGNPKMVACPHRAVNNLLNSLAHDQGHLPNTQLLCTAPATFDAFFYDILVMYATHGTLHITNNAERFQPAVLKRVIAENNITFATLPSEVFAQLDPALPLKFIITMGSKPNEQALARFARRGIRVENDLGHTETGIHLSSHQFKLDDDPAIVGRPLRNMRMRIIDGHGKLCPPGVPGQLYVAGPGLAQGYLFNSKLNAKRFIFARFDPAHQRFTLDRTRFPHSERLYATGDFCSYAYNRHGELEIKFVGRRDDLVKLNGLRIELDELNKLIEQHELVKRAVVVLNDDKTGLVGYIIPTDSAISTDDMFNALRSLRDAHNIKPAAFPKTLMLLSKLPLTPNGKPDLKKLPKPIVLRRRRGASTQSELITLLKPMWLKALKVQAHQEVDLSLSFKDLGGDSINLMGLATDINNNARLKTYLRFSNGEEINLEEFTAKNTIYELEKTLNSLQRPANMSDNVSTLLSPPNATNEENTTQEKSAVESMRAVS